MSSCSSDELDPDYAQFLATYSPAEFDEEFCKFHQDWTLETLSWQLTLSESNLKSPSVLIIPKEIASSSLYPTQKFIKLIDEAIGFSCMCEIEDGEEDFSEKYIGYGWRNYVEVKDLAVGEKMEIMISDNGKFLKGCP